MTAPQATTFPPFISSIFVRYVSAPKEKKENGSQSMLMDEPPNPKVTKKVNIYVYLIRLEMSSRETQTNFQVISPSDALVFKAVAEFEHQIRQNDLWGKK